MSAPLHTLSVAALARTLADKAASSVEATQVLLARAREQSSLGAFLAIDDEAALAQARDADQRRSQGEATPLLGVPIAHKDIFVTRGLPSTAGSKILAGYESPFDATVVARLKAAGTVTLGK